MSTGVPLSEPDGNADNGVAPEEIGCPALPPDSAYSDGRI